MNTTINKAIVALISSVITLLGIFFGEEYIAWATPEVVASLGVILTPLIVWAVPNREV